MAITNPFSITYGDREVGGSTNYQLLGPYVVEKSYTEFRLVFEVILTSASFATLQTRSEALEDDFRKRLTDGDTIVIDINGSKWTYTMGTTLLNAESTIAKKGDPETDRGYSRAYTVSIVAELPADDSTDAGLRDVQVMTNYEASRQKVITMQGTYTATTAGDAKARYESGFDTVASDYLDAIDNSATFELDSESFSMDRQRDSGGNPTSHLCNFSRQYVEILANQTQSALDDPQIKDHRVIFSDHSQYPGDGEQDVRRLRRVVGTYDCAVDISETTNLQSVYDSKVKEHLKSVFTTTFAPQVYGVVDRRVSYDETNKRISVQFEFLYQGANADNIVEMSQSVAYKEQRSLEYTPVHSDQEFAYNVDVGWTALERIWNRTIVAIGTVEPKLRIKERASNSQPIGRWSDPVAGVAGPDSNDTTKVNQEGWNVIASTSQATPSVIGDPDGDTFEVITLTETVVERFHAKPGNRTSVPIQGGGTTGG